MKKRKSSVLVDLSFQTILILMFAAVFFLAFDHAHLATNGILLCIVTLIFMITYFTSIRTGLVLDIIFVFLLIAFMVFRSLYNGSAVYTGIYFWIFWPVGMIVAISACVKQIQVMDKDNEELTRQLEKYVTIDELTQMNNLLAFQRDAAVYMNLSRRYHMKLILVLWKLTYQEDLERLLGKEDMETAIGYISDAITQSVRKEDLVYFVEKNPCIWGTLMFCKPEDARIVTQHVRDGVIKAGLKDLTKQKEYSLELSETMAVYDESTLVPLAFLNNAKKQRWERKQVPEDENKVEDLDEKPAAEEMKKRLEQIEIQLREKETLIEYTEKYLQFLPFRTEYLQMNSQQQEEYYSRHGAEMIVYEVAEQYLKDKLGEDKKIMLKDWKAEADSLTAEKEQLMKEI